MALVWGSWNDAVVGVRMRRRKSMEGTMFTKSNAASLARPVNVLAAFALALSACGGGGSSARNEAVDRMADEGMSREVAECIVDGVEEAFGEEALAEDYEGSDEDLGITFEIADGCLFGE